MGANTIAGVMRAGAYSPNNIDNDAAIFNAVVHRLRSHGFEVNVYTEEEFRRADIAEEVVLNMCREPESVRKLEQLEGEGKLVINSGFGIENCTRERMTRLLLDNAIPYPQSLIVDTGEDVVGELERCGFSRVWIKRGDSHAVSKDDVSYCAQPGEVVAAMHEFALRGIPRAVVNRHLEGDLIKFYGVSGQDWFHWFYPFDEGHSKYGDEVVNGSSRGLQFSEAALRDICQKGSDIMNVKIYGGDCIVGADGSIQIIDFNDWPSFAPCREEAAQHIATCVMRSIASWRKQKGGAQ